MIFPTGGYNCLACGEKSYSALDYLAKKTNRKRREVREEYCKKLGLGYNEYRMAENDVELEGYVPCKNTNHLHILFEDYRRLKELNLTYALCSVSGDTCILSPDYH